MCSLFYSRRHVSLKLSVFFYIASGSNKKLAHPLLNLLSCYSNNEVLWKTPIVIFSPLLALSYVSIFSIINELFKVFNKIITYNLYL
jgi:hypothetical protein